jgi:hypothetical protein
VPEARQVARRRDAGSHPSALALPSPLSWAVVHAYGPDLRPSRPGRVRRAFAARIRTRQIPTRALAEQERTDRLVLPVHAYAPDRSGFRRYPRIRTRRTTVDEPLIHAYGPDLRIEHVDSGRIESSGHAYGPDSPFTFPQDRAHTDLMDTHAYLRRLPVSAGQAASFDVPCSLSM